MLYYKVKPIYDNKKYYDNGKYKGFLISNELYTKKEREKIPVSDDYFDLIEVSKNKTYWFFGARFCAYYC